MPVWGRVCDGNGFSAIVETPYDACMFSSFGRHASFVNSVHWMSSLGKLSYERKIRFTFHSEKCDYNTIAKDFRNYLIEKGKLKTIDDKIKENENIKKLIGCPVLHHKIFSTIQPASKFYDKNSTNQKLYASFEKRAVQMQELKKAGLEKLYIHTDGWGALGYDNLHPYILPPCKEAGGWEGMKALSDTCRSLGYIFALHDQYRDYYYVSKYFDMDKAVMKIDSSHPYCSTWDGGEHTFLCASQALDFVKKTYTELEEHGVDVQGAYLDVFSVVNGDECFNPYHRMSRKDCYEYRRRCFAWLTSQGIIPSSEEVSDWALSDLVLCHYAPYEEQMLPPGSPLPGIPVPLFSLVYHDCMVVPWIMDKTQNRDNMLYALLNGGIPYLVREGAYPNVDGAFEKEKTDIENDIARCHIVQKLHERVAYCRMTDFALLNKTGTKQKAVYEDGTVVEIDLDNGSYKLTECGQCI